jgi:hypothetical protein
MKMHQLAQNNKKRVKMKKITPMLEVEGILRQLAHKFK